MKSLDTYPHFSFILIVRNNLPSNINLFKVSNRNTRKRYEKCSKLTKKCQNDVSGLVLVFLFFWTYFTPFSGVSVVDFEQVSVSWVYIRMILEFHANLQTCIFLFEPNLISRKELFIHFRPVLFSYRKQSTAL